MTSSKTSSAPCVGAQPADGLEKARLGRYDAHVAGDRLDDDAGDLVAAGREELGQAGRVVVLDERACRPSCPPGHAGAVGQRQGEHAAAGGRQERPSAWPW